MMLLHSLRSSIAGWFRGQVREERPIRMVIAGHDLKFAAPIIEYFGSHPGYELRIDEHRGHEIESVTRSRKMVSWADIVFCEWALGNLVWYSRHKRRNQLLFARLHMQEWKSRDRIPYLYDVTWEKVDRLLLVSHFVYERMLEEFPVLRGSRAQVFYLPFDARGRYDRQKLEGAGFNLGMVGIVPQLKRLDLAIAILGELQGRDSRFKLFIKGRRPEEYAWMLERTDELAWYKDVYRQVDRLPNPGGVVFEPHDDAMPEWYRKIGFLLSPSDSEGCHQSVAEGMAGGTIPIIRDWPGANRIYPNRFVWDDRSAAAGMILEYAFDTARREEASRYARHYIHERRDQGVLLPKLDATMVQEAAVECRLIVSETALRQARAIQPAILILAYLPAGHQSGYRIRVEQEIQALIARGITVHLLCLHPKSSLDALSSHRESLRALGCAVYLQESLRFFESEAGTEALSAEIGAILRVLREGQIHILHCEALFCTRLGLFVKERMPDVRVVFDAHGVQPEEDAMAGSGDARVAALNALERRALVEADLLIFVSEAMATHYRDKFGYDGRRHHIVPCCVSEARFAMRGAASAVELPRDRSILAYAGSLAPWQCGEEMIRLFGKLWRHDPRIHVLLLSPASDHDRARELMRAHGLAEEDVTLRALPHDAVAPCLAQAHAGVLLRRESTVNRVSSPTKFAEYLAAGLPVIMTEGIGDFSEFAQQHALGCVLHPGILDDDAAMDAQVPAIAAYVARCWKESDVLGRRCRTAAREHFHWDEAGWQLANRYGRITFPQSSC